MITSEDVYGMLAEFVFFGLLPTLFLVISLALIATSKTARIYLFGYLAVHIWAFAEVQLHNWGLERWIDEVRQGPYTQPLGKIALHSVKCAQGRRTSQPPDFPCDPILAMTRRGFDEGMISALQFSTPSPYEERVHQDADLCDAQTKPGAGGPSGRRAAWLVKALDICHASTPIDQISAPFELRQTRHWMAHYPGLRYDQMALVHTSSGQTIDRVITTVVTRKPYPRQLMLLKALPDPYDEDSPTVTQRANRSGPLCDLAPYLCAGLQDYQQSVAFPNTRLCRDRTCRLAHLIAEYGVEEERVLKRALDTDRYDSKLAENVCGPLASHLSADFRKRMEMALQDRDDRSAQRWRRELASPSCRVPR